MLLIEGDNLIRECYDFCEGSLMTDHSIISSMNLQKRCCITHISRAMVGEPFNNGIH